MHEPDRAETGGGRAEGEPTQHGQMPAMRPVEGGQDRRGQAQPGQCDQIDPAEAAVSAAALAGQHRPRPARHRDHPTPDMHGDHRGHGDDWVHVRPPEP